MFFIQQIWLYLNMKFIFISFFVSMLISVSIAFPVQPPSYKDTLHKKNNSFIDKFRLKKQKKIKKTQDVGCIICEPMDYASDTLKRAYSPPNNDNPCSALVWLMIFPILIIIAVVLAIYAALIISLIILLGSAILFGLYALLLFAMGVTLAGVYIWGGILGSIIVFTAFYFIFCHFCRK